jgi:hemoglobin/transferrin/lactoferrin receptor protein
MKYSVFISVLFFITVFGHTQTVKVVNKANGQAIEDVFVFSKNHSTLTNNRGEADICDFGKNDTLVFQHSAFKTKIISYGELKNKGFLLSMEEGVINLDEMVVSANRWEQDKREVPVRITSIPLREIAFSNPQTTADLLGSSEEVFIQKSQQGGGSPMIRGFATNRVLLVIDGVRMNNAIFRSGNLQNVILIDANAIENAEVVFGPGSVIYGSDAIGGVMDFHSLEPKLSLDSTKMNVLSNMMTRYSSANSEKTVHWDVNLGWNKWASLTSISYSNFGDLKMGTQGHSEYVRPEYVMRIDGKDSVVKNDDKNVQRFSGYNQLNVLQKLTFHPSRQWVLSYGIHYSNSSNVPRYDRLIQYKNGKPKYAEWYYGPQKWMMNTLRIKYLKPTKLFDEAKLIVAYQNYEESRHDRKFGKDKIRERTEQVGAFSVNLDFEKQQNDHSFLFYGMEAVNNDVHSVGQQRDIFSGEITPYASRYPDGSRYASYAAYGDYKNNLTKRMTLVLGLRYSYVLLRARFDTTFYKFPFQEMALNNGALNGSFGLAYRPAEGWQFNLNTSTGFRAPNIDDVGKVFDSEPGRVIVPNKNLRPEYAYNIDFGVAKTIVEVLHVEATGFYTLLKDAMVRRPFLFDGQDSIFYDGEKSAVEALINTGEARIYGVQFGAKVRLASHLSIKGNVNYTHGEDQDGLSWRHVAPLFGGMHMLLKMNRLKADAYVLYNGEITNENLPPSEQDKPYMYAVDENGKPYLPAWTTVNLKIAYRLNKLLRINVGVENILDVRYRPYSSGICAAGRNFRLAVRARF